MKRNDIRSAFNTLIDIEHQEAQAEAIERARKKPISINLDIHTGAGVTTVTFDYGDADALLAKALDIIQSRIKDQKQRLANHGVED